MPATGHQTRCLHGTPWKFVQSTQNTESQLPLPRRQVAYLELGRSQAHPIVHSTRQPLLDMAADPISNLVLFALVSLIVV